ncbi:hypothetical protein CRG98_013780 [Punica granatum]|uniref:Uncharacterized protein n=1 Tax=Punica granatum TaxID=22663 RepID=A0A2I0KDJ8_PUNGR|nr:hypothetical protein CRG98_013780 [Punica granatum]
MASTITRKADRSSQNDQTGQNRSNQSNWSYKSTGPGHTLMGLSPDLKRPSPATLTADYGRPPAAATAPFTGGIVTGSGLAGTYASGDGLMSRKNRGRGALRSSSSETANHRDRPPRLQSRITGG